MSSPFITLTSGRVREGRLDDYLEVNRAITETVQTKEPRVIAFHVMLDEEGERFLGLQFHPDARSLEFHMEVLRDLIGQAGDVLDVQGFTVLGPSSEAVDGLMRTLVDGGVTVMHYPRHVNGFTRSAAAD